MKKKTKIQELEDRIEKLEKRSEMMVYQPPNQQWQNPPPNHSHTGSPCWNNPCYWS